MAVSVPLANVSFNSQFLRQTPASFIFHWSDNSRPADVDRLLTPAASWNAHKGSLDLDLLEFLARRYHCT
jgi:hypothetical protein